VLIGGFQKFSLIDYPKNISAVMFTFGCNFRCPYCHNPELVDPILLNGPLEEGFILDFLESRKNKLDGIVITGGEPTLQDDLVDFIFKIKDMGFLVKLDTNGSYPDIIDNLIRNNLVDYIAMDIKAPFERYREITNVDVDLAKIKESIELIMNSNIDYEFRTTVVKSQLMMEDIVSIAKIIEEARLFVIQRFVPTKVLNPEFINETTYSKEELDNLRVDLLKLVKNCIVR